MSKLFETLGQVLKDESSYEFELRSVVNESTGTSYEQLLRKYDIKSLPTILRLSLEDGLYDYYCIWSAEPKKI
ncbi:MAG: hypothetical protein QXP38_10690 [Nitrososphaerota archaeon]